MLNNWWECSATDSQGVWHDLTLALDDDNLFCAIASVIADIEK